MAIRRDLMLSLCLPLSFFYSRLFSGLATGQKPEEEVQKRYSKAGIYITEKMKDIKKIHIKTKKPIDSKTRFSGSP